MVVDSSLDLPEWNNVRLQIDFELRNMQLPTKLHQLPTLDLSAHLVRYKPSQINKHCIVSLNKQNEENSVALRQS